MRNRHRVAPSAVRKAQDILTIDVCTHGAAARRLLFAIHFCDAAESTFLFLPKLKMRQIFNIQECSKKLFGLACLRKQSNNNRFGSCCFLKRARTDIAIVYDRLHARS